MIKTTHARYLPKRRSKDKHGVNLYPLLGILLVILAAVLGYGAVYLFLS